MKILMILREDFPPDERVAQEASRLMRSGHEVALICFNRKRLPAAEMVKDLQVFRLSPWPSLFRKAHTLFNNAPYRNPGWYRFIVETARRFGAEALHVHDLPLVRTVIAVGRSLGIPVTFDMHENWAELLPSVPRRWFERLYATRHTFRMVEREVCEEVDAVVVVVEESRERLVSLGLPGEKIIITPNVADLERIPESLAARAGTEDEVRFIYAGGLSHHRGLDILIRAWHTAVKRIPDARLTIAGTGPEGDSLRALARNLRLDDTVSFPGWLDFSTYLDSISRSSIGLVPHISTPHTDSTLPHKLFHYMALKKPVIVGDAVPLKRIVESEGCGLVVKSGDVGSMTQALEALAGDESMRREMGEAGYRAVHERYNWNRGIQPLLDYYDALAQEKLHQR
jgi:glycosyltransferase involved in cell wall biosynthesis